MATTLKHPDYSAPCEQPLHPYRRPDPVLVAKIFDEYSPEAAYERWSSLCSGSVSKLAAEGRRIAKRKRAAAA